MDVFLAIWAVSLGLVLLAGVFWFVGWFLKKFFPDFFGTPEKVGHTVASFLIIVTILAFAYEAYKYFAK